MLRRVPHSPSETEILDLGCGDGTVGIFLSGLGYRYMGIDVSEAAIERARPALCRSRRKCGIPGRECAGSGVAAIRRIRHRCRLLLLKYAGRRRPQGEIPEKCQTGSAGRRLFHSVRLARYEALRRSGGFVRRVLHEDGYELFRSPASEATGKPLAGREWQEGIPDGPSAEPEGLSKGTDRGGLQDPLPYDIPSRPP